MLLKTCGMHSKRAWACFSPSWTTPGGILKACLITFQADVHATRPQGLAYVVNHVKKNTKAQQATVGGNMWSKWGDLGGDSNEDRKRKSEGENEHNQGCFNDRISEYEGDNAWR